MDLLMRLAAPQPVAAYPFIIGVLFSTGMVWAGVAIWKGWL
jgi:hypothetical protein